jgi:hypothetical protein
MAGALVGLLSLLPLTPAGAQRAHQAAAGEAYWLSLAETTGDVLRGPFDPYSPLGVQVVVGRNLAPRWALGAGVGLLAAHRVAESVRLMALRLLARSYDSPRRVFGVIPVRPWTEGSVGMLWTRGTAAPVAAHRAAVTLGLGVGAELPVSGRVQLEWVGGPTLEVFPRALGISSISHVGAKLGLGREP